MILTKAQAHAVNTAIIALQQEKGRPGRFSFPHIWVDVFYDKTVAVETGAKQTLQREYYANLNEFIAAYQLEGK